MKTFKDYLYESKEDSLNIQDLLNESHELTPEQDAAIDIAVERILEEQRANPLPNLAPYCAFKARPTTVEPHRVMSSWQEVPVYIDLSSYCKSRRVIPHQR